MPRNYILNQLTIVGVGPETSKHKIINFVFLLASGFVDRSKKKRPTVESFMQYIKQYKQNELLEIHAHTLSKMSSMDKRLFRDYLRIHKLSRFPEVSRSIQKLF